MKSTRLLKDIELDTNNLPIEPTDENIRIASEFVMAKWTDRWSQQKSEGEAMTTTPYQHDEPSDLSGSCKFSSIFAALVFDAVIDGNENHQFAMKDGAVIDLNADASDVLTQEHPYRLDPIFFGSRDHIKSMKSCMPRIIGWVKEFDETLNHAYRPKKAAALKR